MKLLLCSSFTGSSFIGSLFISIIMASCIRHASCSSHCTHGSSILQLYPFRFPFSALSIPPLLSLSASCISSVFPTSTACFIFTVRCFTYTLRCPRQAPSATSSIPSACPAYTTWGAATAGWLLHPAPTRTPAHAGKTQLATPCFRHVG